MKRGRPVPVPAAPDHCLRSEAVKAVLHKEPGYTDGVGGNLGSVVSGCFLFVWSEWSWETLRCICLHLFMEPPDR